MLFIILGIGLGVGNYLWIRKVTKKHPDDTLKMCAFILSSLLITFGLFAGIYGILDYGEYYEYKSTPIYSLVSEKVDPVYVSSDSSNALTYVIKDGEEFKTKTLRGIGLSVKEDPNCTEPRLVNERADYPMNIWQFGLGFESRYIFIVPTGTYSH